MSYNNILKLAQKFSIKLANTENQFENFKSELKSIANEIEGDILTLKVKKADRGLIKELWDLQQNIRHKIKSFDDDQPIENMENILLYLLSKNVKPALINLNNKIQKFLKENEVDFAPHASFSQAKIEGINNLLKLAYVTQNILSQKTTNLNTEPLKSEKEEYSPFAGVADVTKVGRRKLFNTF